MYKVVGSKVYTIEGNTGAGAAVIPNGGAVCQKEYPLTAAGIDGYGRPDWSLVEAPKYIVGWYLDANGWWYADTTDTYLKSCWKVINGHKYYFSELPAGRKSMTNGTILNPGQGIRWSVRCMCQMQRGCKT